MFSPSCNQPLTSDFYAKTQGMCLFACRVTNLRLNQASVSFIARGKLQAINSFSGLAPYILEGIFANHCFGGQVGSSCSITSYCCCGEGSIAFPTVNVPPLFLPCSPILLALGALAARQALPSAWGSLARDFQRSLRCTGAQIN